jgi:RNA polymerase-associated protein RTF1
MLARKNQLQANAHSAAHIKLEKSRLTQARTLAIRRQDPAELAEIEEQLAEVVSQEVSVNGKNDKEEMADRLAKVNERNRKANLEAVRRAEVLEAERKKRDRKLARDGGTPVPGDPTARLKVPTRLFDRGSPRASTPSTPLLGPVGVTREVSPLRLVKGKGSLIDSIEVDLLDF